MHAGDRPNSSSCSTQQRRGSGGGQLGAIEAGRPSLVSSIRLFVPWWLCVVWVRHVLGCGAVWCCFWAVFVGCVAWCLSDLLLHLIIALVLFIPAVKFELLPIFGFFFFTSFFDMWTTSKYLLFDRKRHTGEIRVCAPIFGGDLHCRNEDLYHRLA